MSNSPVRTGTRYSVFGQAFIETLERPDKAWHDLPFKDFSDAVAVRAAELDSSTVKAPSAPVGVEGAPIRYFAYDSDCGDYNEFDTLPEAIRAAQEALDYAGDDGWPPGGPSIYYGAVLGEAREVEGSRRPAGPNDHPDADFIVEYELTGSDALAAQQGEKS